MITNNDKIEALRMDLNELTSQRDVLSNDIRKKERELCKLLNKEIAVGDCFLYSTYGGYNTYLYVKKVMKDICEVIKVEEYYGFYGDFKCYNLSTAVESIKEIIETKKPIEPSEFFEVYNQAIKEITIRDEK